MTDEQYQQLIARRLAKRKKNRRVSPLSSGLVDWAKARSEGVEERVAKVVEQSKKRIDGGNVRIKRWREKRAAQLKQEKEKCE